MPIEFVNGSAYDLPFDDDSFDAARIDRVLQHLNEPVQALREMVRVTRPGGRIVAIDTEFYSRVHTTSHLALERRIGAWWADWRESQPGSGAQGRFVYEHCLEAGLAGVQVVVSSPLATDLDVADKIMGVIENAYRAAEAGAISLEEAQMWEQDLRDRAARGRFFLSFLGFWAHGTVPEKAGVNR